MPRLRRTPSGTAERPRWSVAPGITPNERTDDVGSGSPDLPRLDAVEPAHHDERANGCVSVDVGTEPAGDPRSTFGWRPTTAPVPEILGNDGGAGGTAHRAWRPPLVDRFPGSADRSTTVDLDPGIRASDEDGTELWLPSRLASARHSGDASTAAQQPDIEADVLIGPLAKITRIDAGDAASFASRFAADYLSFDEDDPGRRPEVLRRYLADVRASTLGWSGVGRQRADAPVPGRVERRSDLVVFVEVTLRVTPYARVVDSAESAVVEMDEPPHVVAPSSAPAGDPDAWTPGRAWWVQMTVPITRDRLGQLVVDLSLVPTATHR